MNMVFFRMRCLIALILLVAPMAGAAMLNFDDMEEYPPFYQGDGDGDGIDDVRFTTSDPNGLYRIGPGPTQYYIHEPGLASRSLFDPDLRVDFLFGARDSITFGFAVNDMQANVANYAHFELFDAGGASLGSAMVFPDTVFWDNGASASVYVEGELSLPFSGLASYGLFDFGSTGGDYIIDDFRGDFGSSGVIPEPATAILLGLGMIVLGARRRDMV